MIRTESYFNSCGFSPELQLLCLCSQKSVYSEDRKAIAELTDQPFDWERFCRLVKKHRVYPYVYKNLTAIEGIHKDEQALTYLKQLCTMNMMNSLNLTKELCRVASAFESQGVRMISLKGPALAMSIYHSVSSRVSRDLDVLVNQKELDKAVDILLDLGYVLDKSLAELTPKQLAYYKKRAHHLGYISNGTTLELHWRFETSYDRFDFDRVWANKTDADLFGTKIHILNPEENFLYLVFHGSKHAWKRLRWLNDVAELIRGNLLDWDYIQRESVKRKQEYMLIQALILSHALYGTELPPKLIGQTKETALARQLSILCIPFFESAEENGEQDSLFLQRKKYDFLQKHGLQRKRSFFMANVTPTIDDFSSYTISDRLFFLYFAVRLYTIFKKLIYRKIK
ncbi:nucleotidyltransferase family protein [Caproicibacterium sp. BJN0003]|uniref:nucleotidyltransferase domain-containing protein n=1 Tax=Caproicibacterium sp. BJN0003 TaxID=2994078 RepID=UPI0022531C50|nr:nucleotidyltransferase family protein [Caproicibacterium sp. BJN0003]UZT82599.1 nucleotidyltransferase family protein [Caproicibacterium sp. BJN0003]